MHLAFCKPVKKIGVPLKGVPFVKQQLCRAPQSYPAKNYKRFLYGDYKATLWKKSNNDLDQCKHYDQKNKPY